METNKELIEWLKAEEACIAGLEWVGSKTLTEMWNSFENPNYMTWYLRKLKLSKPEYVLVAYVCAFTVQDLVSSKRKEKTLKNFSRASEWLHTNGVSIPEDLKRISKDDGFSYWAASDAADAAAYAASDAASAAYAASAASAAYAYAAYYAADSAYYAADAADADDTTKNRKIICDNIRRCFSEIPKPK